MKITKSKLRKLIQEELRLVLLNETSGRVGTLPPQSAAAQAKSAGIEAQLAAAQASGEEGVTQEVIDAVQWNRNDVVNLDRRLGRLERTVAAVLARQGYEDEPEPELEVIKDPLAFEKIEQY